MSKYTKELLEPLVRESVSVAEVLRKLGKRQIGSIATHLSNVIKKLGLDTSHFKGKAANCGDNHKGGPDRKSWDKILVNSERDAREKAFVLRRALIECGRSFLCEECGQGPEWRGKTLVLQVNHKNSNWQDNRPENLELLCPNCHAVTEGWSNNKGYTKVTKRLTNKRPSGGTAYTLA